MLDSSNAALTLLSVVSVALVEMPLQQRTRFLPQLLDCLHPSTAQSKIVQLEFSTCVGSCMCGKDLALANE